jgi:hypothetical protein
LADERTLQIGKTSLNDVERALSEIADIRAHLAASTQFRGIAPEANVLTCVLSLAVAAAQTVWPEALAADASRYVAVWAAVAVACTLIVATEAISRAQRLHGRMAESMLGMALNHGLPFAAAGIVLTVAIWRFFPGGLWMLPGVWLILVGLLGFSVLSSVPTALGWVAGWYFLSGTAVLGVAGWNGTLSPWMMGVPFAAGQAAVAFVLHRAGKASHDGG